jgi:2-iminoacetate synthase ThiH
MSTNNKTQHGIDYYMEGERVIFTSFFHIKRGQCCGNGCRHCPYTPKHTKGKITLQEEHLATEQKLDNFN